MDQITLDRLRRQLSGEREGLVTHLVDMGIDPTTGDPDHVEFEQGFADSGQATAEKARVLSMAEGVLDTLREVNDALARIEAGTYGRCESCGQEIPPDRLDARPVARLCMACMRASA